MIVVRDIMRLKFGKAKDVKALMKESKDFMTADEVKKSRVLFDLVGPAYTMVIETTCTNLAEFESDMSKGFSDKRWQEWYQRFIPLVEQSYREIFTIYE